MFTNATAAVNDQRCSQRMSGLHRLNWMPRGHMISGWYACGAEQFPRRHVCYVTWIAKLWNLQSGIASCRKSRQSAPLRWCSQTWFVSTAGMAWKRCLEKCQELLVGCAWLTNERRCSRSWRRVPTLGHCFWGATGMPIKGVWCSVSGIFDAQICSATPPCTYRALLICQLVAVHGTRSYKLSPFLWWEQPHTPLFRPSSPLPHCVHQIVSSSPSFCALASHYLWQNQPKLIARVSRSGWDWHLLRASCVSRFLVLFQINFELLGDESASIIYPHDIHMISTWYPHSTSIVLSCSIFHLFSSVLHIPFSGRRWSWRLLRASQSTPVG